jgi:hypothetical protein
MNRIKLAIILLLIVMPPALIVHAETDEQAQPKKAEHQAVTVQLDDKAEPEKVSPTLSDTKIAPPIVPHRAPYAGTREGYQMVIDVLDGFGGESESDNYRIPVNSGGQSSAIGFSESANWGMAAGYVSATRVTRGDVNADGIINVGDVVCLVNYLYRGGDEPCPVEAGDVTGEGAVNVGDVVFLVNYLYRGGDPPPC